MTYLQLKRLCFILLAAFTLSGIMLLYQTSQLNALCYISGKLIEDNTALKTQLVELGVEPVTNK